MSFVRFVTTVLSLGLFLAGIADKADDPPRWSADQWLEWRDARIKEILPPNETLDRAEVQAKCARAICFLDNALAKEPSLLTRVKGMTNFVAFVRAQGRMAVPGHDLGFEISDRDYVRNAGPAVEFPELLRSPAFLEKMRTPAGYRDAVRMIETQHPEWTVLPYEAQFIKSVDQTTYGRLLVFVPGDQWIQFAIATPDQGATLEVQSVSIVAVKEGQVSFMDYLRRDGWLVPTPTLTPNPSSNCYNCHKSGVVPIHPLTEYAFSASGSLVPRVGSLVSDRLNEKIARYGALKFGPIDTHGYGPALGPPDRPRGDDIPERVRAAMNCGTCHTINYPQALRTRGDATAFKSHVGLVQTYVEKGWMPPGNTLSAEERKVLWQSLLREYRGLLVDWLRA